MSVKFSPFSDNVIPEMPPKLLSSYVINLDPNKFISHLFVVIEYVKKGIKLNSIVSNNKFLCILNIAIKIILRGHGSYIL